MEVNLNNYQVWISDYYDGSLSDAEEKKLLHFLELNPDLMHEFNSFGRLTLYPDISIRIDKASLKKELDNEDPEAIEHCAIALAENDLGPETEREFSSLLIRSEKARTEAETYKTLRLKPDNTIYPDKITLKRIPLRAGIAKYAFRIVASAAIVTLLISLSVLIPRQSENSYTYNSAYLLPFNNTNNIPESSAPLITPVLISKRQELKSINIKERGNKETAADIEEKRIIVAPDSQAFINNVKISAAPDHLALLSMIPAEAITDEDVPTDLSPRQFFAMNFRKHLLKEDVGNTDKLKAYEVADVSINGLNKLLGWDMQFEKEAGDDGKLASFRFTSQLIKLDHKNKNITDEL